MKKGTIPGSKFLIALAAIVVFALSADSIFARTLVPIIEPADGENLMPVLPSSGSSDSITVAAVPEPATVGMLLLGGGLLAGAQRFRRKLH